jgi:hypothetical protein
MPSRPALSLHLGTQPSPLQSSHSVNEVVSAIQRKFSISHVEQARNTTTPPVRRPSFSMDILLHPKKRDKRSDSSDQDPRKGRPNPLGLRSSSKSKDRVSGQSPRLVPVHPGKFEVIIESPPLCFYGASQNSTGALLSGRLKLKVEDLTGKVKFTSFTMVLRLAVSTKKPIGKECNECRERYEEINTWTFLTEPKTFRRDEDSQFPFSYLLKGGLPASTNASLGALKYQLLAVAKTSNGETIEVLHNLTISRAIPPGPDKSSIRIFPPTNLTGRVVLPPVVHPIGTFPVQMTLSGVVENKKESLTRWRLNKLMWRVEELTSMISVPCPKHVHKVAEGKAMKLPQDTKIISHGEMKSGWKTDFDTPGGEIYVELEGAVSTKAGQRGVCDVNSEAGLEVKHALIVELIVAEEYVPKKNRSVITPTGAARILRMQFALTVTERAGMGISWDEEMPPMYEDVPESPPTYPSGAPTNSGFAAGDVADYEGPELEYTDLERMASANPTEPPRYREIDTTTDLPSPSNDQSSSTAAAGPSQYGDLREDVHRPRVGPVFGAGDLDFEPPQYALRPRQPSADGSPQSEEDIGEGETDATA